MEHLQLGQKQKGGVVFMDSFARNISMKFDKGENNNILITVSMTDIFHDIVLKVVVDWEMVIKDLRVDFIKAPRPDCHLIQERLALLIGTPIGIGLTKRLYKVLGGNKGCANLRNMLLCSLPLALNFKAADGLEDDSELLDQIHNQLVGTCIGYAKPLDNR